MLLYLKDCSSQFTLDPLTEANRSKPVDLCPNKEFEKLITEYLENQQTDSCENKLVSLAISYETARKTILAINQKKPLFIQEDEQNSICCRLINNDTSPLLEVRFNPISRLASEIFSHEAEAVPNTGQRAFKLRCR